MLSIHPDAATRDDVARLAAELMEVSSSDIRTQARRASEKIVPDCLSRTCFIKDCSYDHCWGCDDQVAERKRVAAIIESEFATSDIRTQALEDAAKVADQGAASCDGDLLTEERCRDIAEGIRALSPSPERVQGVEK